MQVRRSLHASVSPDTQSGLLPKRPWASKAGVSPPIPDFVSASSRSALIDAVARAADSGTVVVVSNRQPVTHVQTPNGVQTVRPASGLVTALEPVVRAVRGIWVAHGSGSADRRVVDDHDRVGVPLYHPEYTLRRVWLTRQEEVGYYSGLSNNSLWPLCHIAYTRPLFSRSDWEHYQHVNAKFCQAVLTEVGEKRAIVFIQDYHLALLPRMLKRSRPDLTVVLFWHIPWPNREAFRILPWSDDILDGILGADVLGFHLQYHCNNFLDTVERSIEARVDNDQFCVFRKDHQTFVRPFPISVDFEQISRDANQLPVRDRLQELLTEHAHPTQIPRYFVSVDRIDYTKGILERLRAFDKLLTNYPEMRGRVMFLNFCAPSRSQIEAYRELNDKIDQMVVDINLRHRTEEWIPVHFLREEHDYPTVLAAYRMADVLLVTSLHDGMNLVAKEFVAARTDENGVLILSPYTGAAGELDAAMLVNPFDTDQLADAMYMALSMPVAEKRKRMARLREIVGANDIYQWGARIFEAVRTTMTGVALL